MTDKQKKIGIIGGASATAILIAAGVLVTPYLTKDDADIASGENLTNPYEESYEVDGYIEGENTGGLFEEGSDEDSGVFNPNLEVEATYKDGTTSDHPSNQWYSLSEDDGEESSSADQLSKKVSAQSQSAYKNLISKINYDHVKQNLGSNSGDITGTPPADQGSANGGDKANDDLLASYQSQFDELKQHTETLQTDKEDLTNKLKEAEDKLTAAKDFEQMYLDLLASNGNQNNNSGDKPTDNTTGGNDNTNDNTNDKPSLPEQPNDNGNTNSGGDKGSIDNPNSSNNNNNGNTNNGNTGNTNGDKVEDNKPKYISKFSEIEHLTKTPVVVGTATQFKHLDSFATSYYALTTKTNKISDHFSDLLSKYTNQLLVTRLDYEKVDGYENLYIVTPTYLTNAQEVSAIQNEAKTFNNKYRKQPTKVYLKALADYIASKTDYGSNQGSPHSPYNIFTGKNAVCQAYTTYAKIFLDDFGLQNSIAVGTANGELHAWNVITENNVDYHYDFTWYDTQNRDTRYLGASTILIQADHQIDKIVKAIY